MRIDINSDYQFYRSGAANQKNHHFPMIFDFENLFRSEIQIKGYSKAPLELGAPCASKCFEYFCRGAELVKINSIEKQVAKSSKSDDFATPQKHTRVS